MTEEQIKQYLINILAIKCANGDHSEHDDKSEDNLK